jgi:preprotein translocase subunit Sec61beta
LEIANLLNSFWPLLLKMAQERIRMPLTEAGLVRYGEETKSKVIISPAFVIGVCIAIIIIAVALHALL